MRPGLAASSGSITFPARFRYSVCVRFGLCRLVLLLRHATRAKGRELALDSVHLPLRVGILPEATLRRDNRLGRGQCLLLAALPIATRIHRRQALAPDLPE